MDKPIVKIQNISKTFFKEIKKNTVLKNFSVTFETGKVNVLLGPTGCGKSTLLNIIGDILKPDSGRVVFADSISPGKNIRCVFQHYTLFPWLKILQNVSFGMRMQKVPSGKSKEKALSMLETVGLKGYEKYYPHELSGGMRQRTAIAQALATEPKLILMDEPFGALDDFTRYELQDVLVELHKKIDLTTIFVTHSIEEALKLGDRIILLSRAPAQISEDISIDFDKKSKEGQKELDSLYLKIRNSLHNQFQ
jgi:NitT/TauT family transport system ATP-binding protein